MQEKAYWYWREFLKRSDAYAQCCARGQGLGPLETTFKHFGDVFLVSFEEWWEQGQLNFKTEREFVIDEVHTKAHFAALFDDDAEDLLGIIINLNAPIKKILCEIEKILRGQDYEGVPVDGCVPIRKKRKPKLGRPAIDTSFFHTIGVSRILTDQDTKAMDMMLKVFDICSSEDEKHLSQRMRRHEIGRLLGLNASDPSGNPLDCGEENRIITVKVCNYYRKAKALIANAEIGVFPSYSKL